MTEEFKKYISDTFKIEKNDRILVAASAGIDSCVLIQLMLKYGYNIGLAHCNFQLRGQESIDNEEFVRSICIKNNIPFFYIRFDTLTESKTRKISIQMAARELRYEWFQKIANENNYKYIATAHHQNDNIETILLNITKGTGIGGLHGILPQNRNFIRPILFASREEIEQYAENEKIIWQEDSSNISTKYQRNMIRHEVIPILQKINPNLENTFKQTNEKIIAVEQIFRKEVENFKSQKLIPTNNNYFIEIKHLKTQPEYFIFCVFEEFGLNYDQIKNLKKIINEPNPSGKVFFAENYKLSIDRNMIHISNHTKKTIEFSPIIIENSIFEISINNSSIKSQIIDYKEFILEKNITKVYFDLDQLKFPLKIRDWENGDKFSPFGLITKQKVSDLLINSKIPLDQKLEYKLLMDANETILWVIGLRAAEQYKVTKNTTRVLKIEMSKTE